MYNNNRNLFKSVLNLNIKDQALDQTIVNVQLNDILANERITQINFNIEIYKTTAIWQVVASNFSQWGCLRPLYCKLKRVECASHAVA